MGMTQEEKQAYEWALKQQFESVAARNARVLAKYIGRKESAQQSVQRTACTACGSTLRDEFCRNPDCADYQPAAANANR